MCSQRLSAAQPPRPVDELQDPFSPSALVLYLSRGRPVILRGAARHWPAMRRWNFDYLRQRAGQRPVLIEECSGERKNQAYLPLGTFLDWLEQAERIGEGTQRYYLRNWAFARDCPALLADLEVPDFLGDWMQSVPEEERPDLRWVFIGGTGSSSPLHIDVFGTSAWLAVVSGRKHFCLFLPEQGSLLSGAPADVFSADPSKYPSLAQASRHDAEVGAGDILYVPGQWWHAVRNLEPTVAVTMNFANVFNYRHVETATRSVWAALEERRRAELASLLSASNEPPAHAEARLLEHVRLLDSMELDAVRRLWQLRAERAALSKCLSSFLPPLASSEAR